MHSSYFRSFWALKIDHVSCEVNVFPYIPQSTESSVRDWHRFITIFNFLHDSFSLHCYCAHFVENEFCDDHAWTYRPLSKGRVLGLTDRCPCHTTRDCTGHAGIWTSMRYIMSVVKCYFVFLSVQIVFSHFSTVEYMGFIENIRHLSSWCRALQWGLLVQRLNDIDFPRKWLQYLSLNFVDMVKEQVQK